MKQLLKCILILLLFASIIPDIASQNVTISYVSNHYQNHFGWSISGDNNYLAVSDPRDSIKFYGNGCVHIYKKFGYEWEYIQTLQNNIINPYDYFGHRTFMKGDYLAVSSIGDGTMGFMSGAVHIFHLENGIWKFIQTLRQDSVQEKTQFGESIFISGQNLFVGAPGYNIYGAVFIYSLQADTFNLIQKVKCLYNVKFQFAKSITVSDNFMFVGAPAINMDSIKSAVFIFKRNNTLWEIYDKQNYLITNDDEYGNLFGVSISAEKDKLLIGAPHANVINENNEECYFAGKAYYYKNISGIYSLQKEFNNPEIASHDLFGSHVLIQDSVLFISAPRDDVDNLDEGTIYVTRFENNQWVQKSLDSPEDREIQYFSNSFCSFNWQLFIGTGGNKQVKNKGTIYAYDVKNIININDSIPTKEVISVFPNPADEKFRITISENTSYTLRIYSIDGKEFYVNSLQGNNEINVSNLNDGQYIISVNTKKQTYTEKLVILHKNK